MDDRVIFHTISLNKKSEPSNNKSEGSEMKWIWKLKEFPVK